MAEAAPDWQALPESGSTTGLRVMLWLALHAPGWLTDPVLWAVALWFAAPPGRAANRASADYLARVLGRRPTLRDRHRHLRSFAHVMLDRARLLAGGTTDFALAPQGQGLIEARLARGGGAVLLGAHFGSFEALRAFERTLPRLVVRYMMYPDHAPRSTALYAALNPDVAGRVISLAQGQAAMLAAMEALEQGDFIAFLGDRLRGVGGRGQVAVPFLGGTIRLPTSPYMTAMAAQVPIYLCFAPRVGKDRYAVRFSLLHDGQPVPRGQRAALCAALASRYAAALEQMCRDHPDNWFNFYDIWHGADPLPDPGAPDRAGGA